MKKKTPLYHLVTFWIIFIGSLVHAAEFDNVFKLIKIIKLEQKDDLLIGSVRDCLITDDYIYICDSKSGNVKIYNKDGKFYSLLGKKGSGPGEFVTPFALTIAEDKIYAGDLIARKLTVFDKNSHQYQNDFYILDIKEIKVWNNRIYISYSDLTTNTMLHSFDIKGQKQNDLIRIPPISKKNNLISDNISFDIDTNGNIYLVHEMSNYIYHIHSNMKLDSLPFQSSNYTPPPENPVDISKGREHVLKWIKSWTHVLKIDYLEKSDVLLIYLSDTEGNFLDIYDSAGRPLNTGIYTDYRYLYSNADENFYFLEEDDQSATLELRIKQYQLIKKQNISH